MRRASPGFTILELIVALAVTAMCVALVAAGIFSVSRAQVRTAETMELDDTMTMALDRIRQLIQATYITPYPTNPDALAFETFDQDNSHSPYDAITITTIGVRSYKIDAKQADINEVTIFTVDEKPIETPEGRLELRKLRVRVGGEINDNFEVDAGEVYTLAEHVTRFLLEYLDQDGEWKGEWLLLDHPDTLPCAVRITLGLRTADLAEQTAAIMIPIEINSRRCKFEMESLEVVPE